MESFFVKQKKKEVRFLYYIFTLTLARSKFASRRYKLLGSKKFSLNSLDKVKNKAIKLSKKVFFFFGKKYASLFFITSKILEGYSFYFQKFLLENKMIKSISLFSNFLLYKKQVSLFFFYGVKKQEKPFLSLKYAKKNTIKY